MSAGELCPILRGVAFALILAGLLVAEFLNLRTFGMILALLGISTLGAWTLASYLHWEHGE
jgi:hypothetical protein